ncbi:formate dehydrogenase accessory sulfurtransferase FdhD [Methylocapsa sp. S129]|uniref:formate dehydrogenase accessory sulfurtransferase FdhD n=1 Tax=Methylocapsa sp. S129 TaxID=1641869 RepID=UPI00131D03A4|nr:formate dehydrogenase accessory sulfurtransferase FdhD [Methylocapsa sp. S129]
MPRSDDNGSAAVAARDYRYDCGPSGELFARNIAIEAPVNILFGGIPFAVMMTTPADLEDFSIGFALTEGIVEGLSDIRGVEIARTEQGLKVNVALVGERMSAHLARGRAISGRTGCGLCGIDDLAHLPAARARIADAKPIDPAAIKVALHALDQSQPLNAETRAVHAAAWCDRSGAIVALREDVGRHNALDKLIGAVVRSGASPADGFFVITSRCSFEMVAKAAVFGASTLVALSAPTSLAIERAMACGIALIAVARPDHAMIFTEHSPAASGGLAA